MAKFIPDVKSARWVILAPGRLNKPKLTESDENKPCPFCPGNETQTPPEIESIGNEQGWLVRAFQNKYPITDLHEVIVHTPDHVKEIGEMTETELVNLATLYQRRLIALEKEGVPILFRNKGERAGTSITHPHSQIIVLPKQINLDTLVLEPVKNIIFESENFISYCPDFSQYPYEAWIAHKEVKNKEANDPSLQKIKFTQFNSEELKNFALTLQKIVRSLTKILDGFNYNYYIAPRPPFYLRLIPRTITRGGFELGTGLQTNIIDPTDAAENIKKNL